MLSTTGRKWITFFLEKPVTWCIKLGKICFDFWEQAAIENKICREKRVEVWRNLSDAPHSFKIHARKWFWSTQKKKSALGQIEDKVNTLSRISNLMAITAHGNTVLSTPVIFVNQRFSQPIYIYMYVCMCIYIFTRVFPCLILSIQLGLQPSS